MSFQASHLGSCSTVHRSARHRRSATHGAQGSLTEFGCSERVDGKGPFPGERGGTCAGLWAGGLQGSGLPWRSQTMLWKQRGFDNTFNRCNRLLIQRRHPAVGFSASAWKPAAGIRPFLFRKLSQSSMPQGPKSPELPETRITLYGSPALTP